MEKEKQQPGIGETDRHLFTTSFRMPALEEQNLGNPVQNEKASLPAASVRYVGQFFPSGEVIYGKDYANASNIMTFTLFSCSTEPAPNQSAALGSHPHRLVVHCSKLQSMRRLPILPRSPTGS